MTYETIMYEVKDRAAFVTLNRPEKGNTLNDRMHRELNEVWQRINEEEDVWMAVIQGAGDDFCMGEDMDEIADAYRKGAKVPVWAAEEDWQRKFAGHAPVFGWPEPTQGLPGKPLVAAVHGRCYGAGLMFVAHSDFAIAAEDAEFAIPDVSQGMAPVQVVIALTRSLVRAPVLRMAMLGQNDVMTAERARQLGLVVETQPGADLAHRIAEIVDVLNKSSAPMAIRAAKAGVWNTMNMPYDDAQRWSDIYFNQVRLNSEDAEEGLKAFSEKRDPTWQAR